MSGTNSNVLNVLLDRKERLLAMKRMIFERAADNNVYSSESFLEDSNIEVAEDIILPNETFEDLEVPDHYMDNSEALLQETGPSTSSVSLTSKIRDISTDGISEILVPTAEDIVIPNESLEDLKDPDNCIDNSEALLQETGLSTSFVNLTSKKRDISTDGIVSKKKRRMTSTFTKSCMDFLGSENQDFSSGSSDLWSEKESSSDESAEESQKKKKKKRNKTKSPKTKIVPMKKIKHENKRKRQKHLREKGLSYVTSTGNVKKDRSVQENPCKKTSCARKCYEITEERRNSLFNYFWELSNEKKRDWLVQCCKTTNIQRKKTKNTASRRSLTYQYFINEGEGRRQVCQQFIMKTLDISQTYILYNIDHAHEGLSSTESRTRTAPDKYGEDTKLYAKKYIETLPALPSHYSRKNSTKLYLPEHFNNVSNLYRLYLKYCLENSKNYLSEKLFKNLFKEYNYAFHVPKKDKCPLCTKKENNPDLTTNEELTTHLLEKDATYKRFKIHQNLKSDETLIVASFDLQKVLGTPHGESMMLYYSRKYAVYNFTVYESRTQNGYCYTWGESDGKRGSCEIATCLFQYLKEVDSRGVKTLLLYCDNCTGQNKNKVLLSMLKYFLAQSINLEIIQINYLLVGHTYMPVDSMHAVIEREIKKLIVWAPSQWPTFMESSRKQPLPYKVNVLEHSEFINFNNLAESVFTSATLKNNDLRMKHIRVCTFKKSNLNFIEIKYTMVENGTVYKIGLSKQTQEKSKAIGKRITRGISILNKKMLDNKNENTIINSWNVIGENNNNLPRLYKERLSISILKYNDLKKLCDSGIIPKRFHAEYINLPNKSLVKDRLDQTDEDDNNSEGAICEDD